MGSDWSILLRPTPRKVLNAMLRGASSLTELSEATGMGKSALVPHLKELVGLGVLTSERVPIAGGVEARYHLQDSSLHLSIDATAGAAIAWATAGVWSADVPLLGQVPQPDVRAEVAAFLRALVAEAPSIARDAVVILFGSGARGEATWKSDVDLLVLTDDPEAKRAIDAAAFVASEGSQHAVVPLAVKSDDFARAKKRIYGEAAREGMLVWVGRKGVAPWSRMERYKAISI